MEYSFGTWIKRRRKALDLTQQELARRVGCSVSAIVKIESDERRPSRQIAELLAQELDISDDQHDLFLKVARQEKATDTLGDMLVSKPDSPSPAYNLPNLPNPIIGREFERAEITRLILEPQCRLLTLTGQGGIGKTHLAVQAAFDNANHFEHRAVFVNLAPVLNREQSVSAIADALGIVLYSASDRADQLISYLRDKELLLLLDNFEQLIYDPGSIDLITDILRGTSKVKILTTTRQPLQLQAEWVFDVQGLPVPKIGITGSAVELFLQRAKQASVSFVPDRQDVLAIVRICELVEGLPMGIELAAAWVRALSCQEIADEIQRSIDFLEVTARDLPERHRSIRATIEHSWKQLNLEEQSVLRQVSIFLGGFTRQAAEEVASASLAVLSTLVSKSLIRRADSGRYDLHELIRQFLWVRLQENDGENAQTRARYCLHYAKLLANRGHALKGSNRTAVVSELQADIANLRQAWQWASAFQNARELSLAADTLFWLYESQSNCREGVPLFGETVENLRQTREATTWEHQLALAQALSYQGFFMFRQGRHPQGREALLYSKAILEEIFVKNPDEVRMALSNTYAFLGTVTFVMGDFEEGDCLLQKALKLKEELNDYWGLAFSLRQIGISAYHRGDNTRASESLERSLSISQKIGNVWSIAASLNQLGIITLSQGMFEQARKYLSDALDLSYKLEDRASIAAALDGLGLVGAGQGEYDDAKDLLDKSIALWDEIGEQGSFAHSLNHLGNVWKQTGNTQMARKHYLDALRVAIHAEITPVLLNSLIGEAEIQMLEGDVENGLEILLAASQSSSLPRAMLERMERLRAECESKLPGDRVQEIVARVENKHLTMFAHELLSTARSH